MGCMLLDVENLFWTFTWNAYDMLKAQVRATLDVFHSIMYAWGRKSYISTDSALCPIIHPSNNKIMAVLQVFLAARKWDHLLDSNHL